MTPEGYMNDPRLPTMIREAKAFLAWPNTVILSKDEHMARHMAAFGLQMLDVAHARVRPRDEILTRTTELAAENDRIAETVAGPPKTIRELAEETQLVVHNTIRIEALYWVCYEEDK